jgi:hypothetical protein
MMHSCIWCIAVYGALLYMVHSCIWCIAVYGAETRTFRAVEQKHMESFEIWCLRRMEMISWTDHMRSEEILLRIREQRNILHEISKRKAIWIGHILRTKLPSTTGY